MAYTIDENVLVDGPLTQVDDTPRYPLGYKVTDKNGKEYIYVKATGNLTAGTAATSASRSSLTVTASSAFKGGFIASAATPALATTGFDGNELAGTLVKITRNSAVLGLFPITGAEYNGTAYVVSCPEVEAGDTVAFGVGANIVGAGGAASTKIGAINVIPIATFTTGKYGFVTPSVPIKEA